MKIGGIFAALLRLMGFSQQPHGGGGGNSSGLIAVVLICRPENSSPASTNFGAMPDEITNLSVFKRRWHSYEIRRSKKAMDAYFDEVERMMWPVWAGKNWGPEVEWDNYRRIFGEPA